MLLLLKNNEEKMKKKRTIEISDQIYPLTMLTKHIYQIKDHINLSGFNPLKGASFISLTNTYESKDGIVIACLKKGTHPNNKEKKILLKAGVKAYCYNLAQRAILASSKGLKVKAYGVIY